MRILVADDSSTLRNHLQKILQKLGHEVVTASDGREAWELPAQDDAPELAILDWEMPFMNGPQLCRKF